MKVYKSKDPRFFHEEVKRFNKTYAIDGNSHTIIADAFGGGDVRYLSHNNLQSSQFFQQNKVDEHKIGEFYHRVGNLQEVVNYNKITQNQVVFDKITIERLKIYPEYINGKYYVTIISPYDTHRFERSYEFVANMFIHVVDDSKVEIETNIQRQTLEDEETFENIIFSPCCEEKEKIRIGCNYFTQFSTEHYFYEMYENHHCRGLNINLNPFQVNICKYELYKTENFIPFAIRMLRALQHIHDKNFAIGCITPEDLVWYEDVCKICNLTNVIDLQSTDASSFIMALDKYNRGCSFKKLVIGKSEIVIERKDIKKFDVRTLGLIFMEIFDPLRTHAKYRIAGTRFMGILDLRIRYFIVLMTEMLDFVDVDIDDFIDFLNGHPSKLDKGYPIFNQLVETNYNGNDEIDLVEIIREEFLIPAFFDEFDLKQLVEKHIHDPGHRRILFKRAKTQPRVPVVPHSQLREFSKNHLGILLKYLMNDKRYRSICSSGTITGKTFTRSSIEDIMEDFNIQYEQGVFLYCYHEIFSKKI